MEKWSKAPKLACSNLISVTYFLVKKSLYASGRCSDIKAFRLELQP